MQHTHQLLDPMVAGSYRLVMNNIELRDKDTQILQLKNELDQMEQERDYYRGKYLTLQKRLRDNANYTAFTVDKIKEEYYQLENKYHNAKKNLDTLQYHEKHESELKSKLDSTIKQLKSIERENQDLRARAKVAEENEAQLEEVMENLRATSAENRHRYDELERLVLQSAMKSDAAQIEKLVQTEELQNQIASLQLQNAELNSYIEVIEWRNKVNDEDAKHKDEVLKKNELIAALEKELTLLRKNNEIQSSANEKEKESSRHLRRQIENV